MKALWTGFIIKTLAPASFSVFTFFCDYINIKCTTFKPFLLYQMIVVNEYSDIKDSNFESIWSDLE